jgi:ligand-binding sensor domain-containing protein
VDVILHYDGTQWSTLSIPTLALAIWGTSRSDVWAATSPGLLHYDGARWSTIQSGFLFDGNPNTGAQPYAVWGSSPSSVWMGGWAGVAAYTCCGKMEHYDGRRWSDVPLPEGTSIIYAIWGSSASDVWAGTATGIIHGTPAKP